MFDTLAVNEIINQIPALTTLYWTCAVIGIGLLLVSLLAGSHGHGDIQGDIGLHVHSDVDAADGLHAHAGDLHHHAGAETAHASSLATWFSIRFLIFFLAVFGAVGVILTHMTQHAPSVTLGASLAGGIVIGQAVHHLFRKIRQTSGDSTPQVEDYLNQFARVTVPVARDRTGEIAVSVRGAQKFLPATVKHPDAAFNIGDEVAVVAYNGGVAEVVSRKEFEFLNNE